MTTFAFLSAELTVRHAGETIRLLPKEYDLLDFLYRHRGRTFTREELLDRVWTLETPVDRTVDDHVYRLRKKLKPWAHLLALETVRGRGYRLAVKEAALPNPLLQDRSFAEELERMTSKYRLFGQGEAIRMLAENGAVLGGEINPTLARFIAADVDWFLEGEDIPAGERIVCLLFLYMYMHFDMQRMHHWFSRAVQSPRLTSYQKLDLRLNIADFLIDLGERERAQSMLADLQAELESDPALREEREAFVLFFLLAEIYLHLDGGDMPRVAELIARGDELLERYPYRREQGIFGIVKGIRHFEEGRPAEAEAELTAALDVLRQTQFLPHLITGIRIAAGYFAHRPGGEEFARTYHRMWQEYADEHGFAEQAPRIEAALRKLLN